MTEPQENTNEKLLEDLNFMKDLWKEHKKKQKKSREDFQTPHQEDFQSNNEKGRDKFMGKRYKTPWEAGEQKSKDKYEKKKNYKRNNFRRNEDREFEKSYKNADNTTDYHKTNKRRETREYIDFIDNRNEDIDFIDNRKQEQFNKLGNESAISLKEEQEQTSHTPKEEKNKKSVNWKLDDQPNLIESKSQEDHPIPNSDAEEDHNESDQSWKSNSFRSADTNRKWNKQHSSRESSKNTNEKANLGDEKLQKQWDSKRPTLTNRKWDKRDQTPFGERSRRYKDFRGLRSDRYKDKNNSFKASRYEEPKYFDDSNKQGSNWKWDRRGKPPYLSGNQQNREFRGWKEDRYEGTNISSDEEPTDFEGSKNQGPNWKWTKREQSPYGNRNQRYKEFSSWKSDKFKENPNSINTRDYDKPKNFEESNKQGSNWKWAKRGESPSGHRNQHFRESRGWKSDKYNERGNKFKSHDNNDFKESRKQWSSKKFEKKKYKTDSNQMDKENDNETSSEKHDTRSMSMVKRREWGAPKTKWGIGPSLKFPLKYIFCMPTFKRRCFNLQQCTKELLYLHGKHTSTPTCPDIKFSFFIGTDGTVYECRGWRTRPGLPVKYEANNKDSLFIAFAGHYNEYNTPPAMKKARDYIIDYGVQNNLIDENYTIRSAVDFPTAKESKADRDHDQDHETNDQETDDQKTEDQLNRDLETQDEDKEDPGIEEEGSQSYETDQGSGSPEVTETHGLGSDWEDQLAKELSSESGSPVKSWESYSSSWDLSEGDFDKEDLIEDQRGA